MFLLKLLCIIVQQILRPWDVTWIVIWDPSVLKYLILGRRLLTDNTHPQSLDDDLVIVVAD